MFVWSPIVLLLAVAQVLKSEIHFENKVEDYANVSPSIVLNRNELFVLTGFVLILLGFVLAFYRFYRQMKPEDFLLQENIPSKESHSNHKKIAYLPNGVHFSKKYEVLKCIGIFTSLVICAFIILLYPTVWIYPEISHPEIYVGNISSIEPKKEKLVKYFQNISGSKTISGVDLYDEREVAIGEIQRIAGVHPGILTTRMPKYSAGNDKWQIFVENTISDWNNHYLLHIQYSPLEHPLYDILRDRNEKLWNDLISEKGETNKLWKKDLDALAPFLLQLQTAGVVPILYLFPDINHTWYLWGGRGGLEGSLKLFQITKDYLTQHHGLTSFIWKWSLSIFGDMKRPEKYWPGDDYVDVVSVNMQNRKELNSDKYKKLLDVVGDKPIAMEYLWSIPSTELLATQTRWAYFTVWDGLFNNKYYPNTDEDTKRTFCSHSVINRETNPFFN